VVDCENVTRMTVTPIVTGASAAPLEGVNTTCTVSAPRPVLTVFSAVTVTVCDVVLDSVTLALVVLHW
jgi:hypothetical protein